VLPSNYYPSEISGPAHDEKESSTPFGAAICSRTNTAVAGYLERYTRLALDDERADGSVLPYLGENWFRSAVWPGIGAMALAAGDWGRIQYL